MKSEYNVAPSDLTHLLNDCPRCFWLKVKHKVCRPYTPFPSVFGKIDKAMRGYFHGRPLSDFCDVPINGCVDTTEKKIKSAPIWVGDGVINLSGKMDARVDHPDGVGIVDFKTSETKEDAIALYKRQLHAYAQILAHPAMGTPVTTKYMGLLCVTPESMEVSGENAHFKMAMTWKPIEVDWDWWNAFLADVVTLLNNPDPDGKKDCIYCELHRYRLTEKQGALANVN